MHQLSVHKVYSENDKIKAGQHSMIMDVQLFASLEWRLLMIIAKVGSLHKKSYSCFVVKNIFPMKYSIETES